jgi:hypothetical protein
MGLRLDREDASKTDRVCAFQRSGIGYILVAAFLIGLKIDELSVHWALFIMHEGRAIDWDNGDCADEGCGPTELRGFF